MARVLSSIFLSLLILAQSVMGTLVLTHYQVNKKYIAQTLCENKNIPSKKCKGKCYLRKQLKKAESSEASVPGMIKEKMEMVYTLEAPFHFAFISPNILLSSATFYVFFASDRSTPFDPRPPRA